jgi:hypothetical protein
MAEQLEQVFMVEFFVELSFVLMAELATTKSFRYSCSTMEVPASFLQEVA